MTTINLLPLCSQSKHLITCFVAIMMLNSSVEGAGGTLQEKSVFLVPLYYQFLCSAPSALRLEAPCPIIAPGMRNLPVNSLPQSQPDNHLSHSDPVDVNPRYLRLPTTQPVGRFPGHPWAAAFSCLMTVTSLWQGNAMNELHHPVGPK